MNIGKIGRSGEGGCDIIIVTIPPPITPKRKDAAREGVLLLDIKCSLQNNKPSLVKHGVHRPSTEHCKLNIANFSFSYIFTRDDLHIEGGARASLTKEIFMNDTARKIILIDQDGVLGNYVARFLEIWRAEHPEKIWVSLEDSLEHDVDKNYPAEYRDIIEEITVREGFFRGIRPIEGAKEALEHMLALGHDVRICTAPKRDHTYCVPEKFAWVEKHFGGHWAQRIILTRDKTLVHGDILIDDKPNITGVRMPSWEHVFYDQPYNRAHNKRRLNWSNYCEILGL